MGGILLHVEISEHNSITGKNLRKRRSKLFLFLTSDEEPDALVSQRSHRVKYQNQECKELS